MKFITFLLIIFFNFQFSYSQVDDGPEPPPATLCEGPQPPPPSGGPCENCNYLMEWNPYTCEYIAGAAYDDCVEANCPTLLPISENSYILLMIAVLLGLYYVPKIHKKRTN